MSDALPPLTLAPALDLRAAVPLKAELAARMGAPLELDAAQVERVGGLCLQVLIAAAAAWRAAGHDFQVVNPSPAFSEDIARLGAAERVPGSQAPC